jgi:hypothetical protein
MNATQIFQRIDTEITAEVNASALLRAEIATLLSSQEGPVGQQTPGARAVAVKRLSYWARAAWLYGERLESDDAMATVVS